jgi:DNA-directed RNA polymerase II subunit RPB7
VDGVVTSVIRAGFFVDCGSLQAFVGRGVSLKAQAFYSIYS